MEEYNYNIQDQLIYNEAFKKGLHYVLFESNINNRKTPSINLSDLESIGYSDGFQYGEICEITSQTMSIKNEQLLAIMDKNFTHAIEKMMENKLREKQYTIYREYFLNGAGEVLKKYKNDDETYDFLPIIDISSLPSIGYFDGYSFGIQDLLSINGILYSNNLDEIEERCRDKFTECCRKYDLTNIKLNNENQKQI